MLKYNSSTINCTQTWLLQNYRVNLVYNFNNIKSDQQQKQQRFSFLVNANKHFELKEICQ